MHPDTLRAIAAVMRESIDDEYPASPQQQGAFAATASWAGWLDGMAGQVDAELPEDPTQP